MCAILFICMSSVTCNAILWTRLLRFTLRLHARKMAQLIALDFACYKIISVERAREQPYGDVSFGAIYSTVIGFWNAATLALMRMTVAFAKDQTPLALEGMKASKASYFEEVAREVGWYRNVNYTQNVLNIVFSPTCVPTHRHVCCVILLKAATRANPRPTGPALGTYTLPAIPSDQALVRRGTWRQALNRIYTVTVIYR